MEKKQFIKFIAVGCTNTVLSWGVYLLLNIYLPYTVAFTFAYLTGLLSSYFLSANWVFKAGTSLKSFIFFPLVYLIQYVIGLVLLKFFVESLHINETWSPLIVTAVTMPLTFLFSKLLFKLTQNAQ